MRAKIRERKQIYKHTNYAKYTHSNSAVMKEVSELSVLPVLSTPSAPPTIRRHFPPLSADHGRER